MDILSPVTNLSFEDHFLDNSWSSPQDQIDAGFPRFIQPANPTATFLQTFDLGVEITNSVLVQLAYQVENIEAGVDYTFTISLSDDDITYTDYVDTTSVYSSNFRYIKVLLEVESDGVGLVRFSDLKITVGIKIRRDGGRGNALAADSGGTTVSFNRNFFDITSIEVTAAHQVAETEGITAVYDFVDVPNPTSFKVLLFSNSSGNRIDGDFSWSAQGY